MRIGQSVLSANFNNTMANCVLSIMQKKILMLLFLVIFLVGCNGIKIIKNDPTNPNKYTVTGTGGVSVEFLQKAPPPVVYAENNFPVAVKLVNTGGSDIAFNEKTNKGAGVLALSVEPDYNCVISYDNLQQPYRAEIDQKTNCPTPDTLLWVTHPTFSLLGRSRTMPKGEEKVIYFDVFAKKLDTQSESRSSTVIATACYPYQTMLTSTVCVDTDPLGIRHKNKVCSVQNIDGNAGQGAPVAIPLIEPRIVPKGSDILEPHFVIHVENRGMGQVVNAERVEQLCKGEGFNYRDEVLNRFTVIATLGTEQLMCENEGKLRLYEKKDSIRCWLDMDKIFDKLTINKDPYTTQLSVILTYGYTQSASATYKIERPQ